MLSTPVEKLGAYRIGQKSRYDRLTKHDQINEILDINDDFETVEFTISIIEKIGIL